MPGLCSTERNEARSINSTAATGWLFSTATASQAVLMSGKIISAVALWVCSSTVR